jgi:hypothetical protein
VARPLSDPAVGNGFAVWFQTRSIQVNCLQLGPAFEGPIWVDCCTSGDILSPGNVASPLRRLRQSRRSDDLACEFVGTSNVDQFRGMPLQSFQDFGNLCTNRKLFGRGGTRAEVLSVSAGSALPRPMFPPKTNI